MNARSIPMRGTALAVVAAMLSGCVTTDVQEEAFAPSRQQAEASLEVVVYETHQEERRGRAFPREVRSRVISLAEKEIVGESSSNRWTIERLPPGRYRVEVTGWTQKNGEHHEADSGESLTIQGGEATVVTFTLRDPYPVVVPVLCGIAVGAFLAYWKDRLDNWGN